MINEKIQKIDFIDIKSQRDAMGPSLHHAIENVMNHGNFILGPEVQKLEQELLAYTGCTEVVTCSDGTDALSLLLMAHNVGPGDAVFVPSFTFAATAEVVAKANAIPIFVDICPNTFNIDTNSLQQAIAMAKTLKVIPKGIIAVDLFGLPADYPAINEIAQAHNLWVIADAAQSFGGGIGTQKVGALSDMSSTSFFPSKPLSCFGDGGAVFVQDSAMAAKLRSLRNHGCGVHRYDHIHIGINSRLDTLQAAILLEKLKIFPQEHQRRSQIASIYTDALHNWVKTPSTPQGFIPAWGLYTVQCLNDSRDILMNSLNEAGIPSNIYYRKPLHLQPAYAHYPRAQESLHQAELASQTVLSLPMHPYLLDIQVEYIIENIKETLG